MGALFANVTQAGVMPSRRQVLTGLGTAGSLGIAGCTGVGDSAYTPGTDETTDWPMPAYDRGFAAFNPDAAAPRDGATERWSKEIPLPSARPVVAGDTVLVPTAQAVIALDLATGEERWRYGQDQPWASGPVVHGGTVYAGFADQSELVALDLATGAEQWQTGTDGDLAAAPTFDHGYDHLYAGDDTGRIYEIDATTGEITIRGEVFGPVTALAHGGMLLVGTGGGEVYSLFRDRDGFTGQWRRRVGGSVTSLAVAPDGAIFVGTFGGPLYRLQDGAHAGTSRWEAEQGATNLAATGGDVVGSGGAGLQQFDSRSGSAGWNREGRYDAAPAIAGDTVYVGGQNDDASGFVAAYALSGGTGIIPLTISAKRWQFNVESGVTEGVAVADGAVFAVTQGGEQSQSQVYALDEA